jgi:putative transposase
MGIARSTYYGAPAADRDAEIVALIEAICAEFEAYGYRRVTAELRHQGQLVNSKRVRRLMREHGLSPRQRRRYVTTTDSDHDEPIFPNLAADMAPDGPNQLWVADITYVAIATGFVYLAAILDAWSRRVVGYAISRSIDARLTIAALDAAVRSRAPPAGCVHHSDRGSQGGFKRSSQHSEVGGCDEHSKAAIGTVWTGAITFTRTAARRGARRTDKILAGNRHGAEQRRCCARSRSVAACRNQMVPKGGRHATSDVQILGEAALRALPVIGGARGDRTAEGAGLFHTGDWASPRAGSLDNLP